MKQDVSARLEKRPVAFRSFDSFFADNGLYSEQIIALCVDPECMQITVAFSRELPECEVSGEIADPQVGFELVTYLPLATVTFIETTRPIPRLCGNPPMLDDLLASFWRTLPDILNSQAKPDNSFYLASNARQLCCQYYLVSGTRTFPVYEPGKPGVTSIRYDIRNDRLVGIRVNDKGHGDAIVQFPARVAIRKPHKLDDVGYWKPV